MANIKWDDIKHSFNSWEELSNSGLTFDNLNKDTFELTKTIYENDLKIPDKFKKRLEELCKESIDTYNKYSSNKITLKKELSIYELISLILAIIQLLMSLNSALSLQNKAENSININVNISTSENTDCTDDLVDQINNIEFQLENLIKEFK